VAAPFRVRLVTRPNGSTAWVRAADMTITDTPCRIVVSLSAEHLRLYRLGKQIMDAPAGIGTKQDPTPTGQYFVAMLEQAASAAFTTLPPASTTIHSTARPRG
jgi:hypothetical protein